MVTLMIVVLGWCAVSVAAAGFWATLCAGGRRSGALEALAGQQRQAARSISRPDW